jgi:elongation factor G
MDVATDRVRNVALLGHSGNGKTSLAEALLYRAGVVPRMGTVEGHDTVCDTEPEEHRRAQSLSLAMAPFEWEGHRINLIDTPGYVDFAADSLAALRVADLAVFVVDAVDGVQTQDELLWRVAGELGRPRMIFLNKLDRDRAGFERTLAQIKERFTATGIEPVELPIGEESDFHGVADLITEHVWLYDSGRGEEAVELPAEIADREHEEHDHLVEDVVEQDDALLERYLDGEEPTLEELERVLHAGVDRAAVFPVLVGSATEPIGVDRLASFIVHVGPAPSEAPPVMVYAGGRLTEVACDPEGDPLALVFKTFSDPYVGRVSVFKVLSGTIGLDDVMINPRTGARERMHSLIRLCGSGHEPVAEVRAGDIGAVTKLDDVVTGDTLAPERTPVTVAAIDFPEPVHGVAITARHHTDEDKLTVALRKVVAEDPALTVEQNDETGQTVLRGMGDAHIKVTLDRLDRRYGVVVDTDELKVAYRETLNGPVEADGRHKKQTGGRGQFGVATVRFEPLERGAGFEFVDEIVGAAIPRNLVPAVQKGIVESMARGGNLGFPVVDIRATVTDGRHHAVDSDEMSFKMAGALAFREAIRTSGTTVLEPFSIVAVTAPDDLQGEILGDLSSRRGQVTGTEVGPGDREITVVASVPSSEIVAYAIELRSMTHGRGRFTARFDRYEALPAQLVDTVTAAAAV